jgi:hypothetical protein
MPDSVVLSADKALYIAKSEGRSCVRKVMMMVSVWSSPLASRQA